MSPNTCWVWTLKREIDEAAETMIRNHKTDWERLHAKNCTHFISLQSVHQGRGWMPWWDTPRLYVVKAEEIRCCKCMLVTLWDSCDGFAREWSWGDRAQNAAVSVSCIENKQGLGSAGSWLCGSFTVYLHLSLHSFKEMQKVTSLSQQLV